MLNGYQKEADASRPKDDNRPSSEGTWSVFETPLTIVGHIVNDLQRRKTGCQEVVTCRVASNARRSTGDRGRSRLYQRVREPERLTPFVVGDAGNLGRSGFVAGDCTH